MMLVCAHAKSSRMASISRWSGCKGQAADRSGHGHACRLVDVDAVDGFGIDFFDRDGQGFALDDARQPLAFFTRSIVWSRAGRECGILRGESPPQPLPARRERRGRPRRPRRPPWRRWRGQPVRSGFRTPASCSMRILRAAGESSRSSASGSIKISCIAKNECRSSC